MGVELGFLDLDGVQVANSARTIKYLELGLGPIGMSVGGGCPCTVLTRVELSGVVPVSPSVDPAPWYNAADPESAEFLGLLISGIRFLDAPHERDVQARGGAAQGASLGPLRLGGRRIEVTGFLIASSDDGSVYGQGWVASKLAACGDCATGVARLRASCPPDNASDDTRGEYRLYDVGLIEGLTVGEAIADCPYIREVTFTLVASNPWLYGALTACLAATILNPAIGGAPLTDQLTTYPATWTTDTGAAPTPTAQGLQPGSTATARYRRNDRTMIDGAVTWKVTTGASVAGFGVFVFGRSPGAADTFLAADWRVGTQVRIVKRVAGVETALATAGGPAATPAVSTAYWVRFGFTGKNLSAEVWNADPDLITSTLANRIATAEHVLSQADMDTFTGGFTGLMTTVDATDERYTGYVFDPAMDFDRWWTYQWPDALECSPTQPAYGGVAGVTTLVVGATHQINGAVIVASTGAPLEASATLQTTTTLPTSEGTLAGVAVVRDAPVGTTLVYDSALRRITAVDALGVQTDGTRYLSVGGEGGATIWQAAEVCATAIEFDVQAESYGGTAEDTTAQIQTQTRARS